MNDIYRNVAKEKKIRADHSIRGMVLTAIAIMIVPMGLILYAVRYSYRYREYMQDLTESFVTSEKGSAFLGRVIVEGEALSVSADMTSALFYEINRVGMGRTCQKDSEPAMIELHFTDGASLCITETDVRIENGEYEEGIVISYVNSRNQTYTYETPDLKYIQLRKILKGSW